MQHLGIVVASVLLGLVVAFPLALLARRYRRLEGLVLGTTTAIYTIPSLALFSLLVPLTGLGVETVVLGLGLYSLTILVRNILDGLRAVPSDVRESAVGMGYAPGRLLWRVELPLALPTIMAGVRIATVSAVALTTVGAILDYGGLGDLLDRGQAEQLQGAGAGHQRPVRAARHRPRPPARRGAASAHPLDQEGGNLVISPHQAVRRAGRQAAHIPAGAPR